jgi:hypothetical protein
MKTLEKIKENFNIARFLLFVIAYFVFATFSWIFEMVLFTTQGLNHILLTISNICSAIYEFPIFTYFFSFSEYYFFLALLINAIFYAFLIEILICLLKKKNNYSP